MCGLIAAVGCSTQACELGLRSLERRGPDGSGVWVSPATNTPGIFLGHRRLAILDLSSEGAQPVKTLDGRFSIVFNGEIYNYREIRDRLSRDGIEVCGTGDTGVLSASWMRWGKDCLEQLEGMFAMVVVDHVENKIHAVRDRFGIKPLYFARHGNTFAFASEPRAVLTALEQKPDIDRESLVTYLAYGDYDRTEHTFYAGVKQLRSAEIRTFALTKSDLREESVKQYWDPPTDLVPRTLPEAVAEATHLLERSIELHLRSDVPIGISLSGGLDSSLLLSFVTRTLDDKQTLTAITYRDSKKDEWTLSQEAAQSGHGVVRHLPADLSDFWATLDETILAQGEPFSSFSVIAQQAVYRTAKGAGLKVLLEGQGADEVFAGYLGYPQYRIASTWHSGQRRGALRFGRRWSQLHAKKPFGGSMRLAAAFEPHLAGKLYALQERARWSSVANNPTRGRRPWLPGIHSGPRALAERLKVDLLAGIRPLMRHADRNAMWYSIENRVPYLDRALVEFALTLPADYLVGDNGHTKRILRILGQGRIPYSIRSSSQKIGFEASTSSFLRQIQPHSATLRSEIQSLDMTTRRATQQTVERLCCGTATALDVRIAIAARWRSLIGVQS